MGDSIAAGYRCYSPPVDDLSAYVDLGSTPQGVPVRVFRPVAEADLRILIGSVLPHLQAGFGGGYKLIFPGTSHRTTLGALHRQGLDGRSDPAGLLGRPCGLQPDAASDPRRGQAARAMLVDQPSDRRQAQVFRVVAGDPERVQDLLAAEASRRLQAPPSAPADLVVAGNHPWPGDPMQSFKVLLHHRAACRSGGVLIGLFWTDPAEIDRSFPMAVLRGLPRRVRSGAGRSGGSYRSAQRLVAASRARRRRSCFGGHASWSSTAPCLFTAPLCVERIGPRLGPVRLFADQSALWQAAAIGPEPPWQACPPSSPSSFSPGRADLRRPGRDRSISKLRPGPPLRTLVP